MLVVAGTLDFDPVHREAALAAAIAMQHATRAEAGCLAYSFSADLEDPGRLHVAEKWTSQEALDAHFAAPHKGEFGKAAAAAGIKNGRVLKYEETSEAPVR